MHCMAGLFDFTHAIVRTPGASVVNGLREGAGADPSFSDLLIEHITYVAALRGAGLEVDVLDPLDVFPDSVFVEDVALTFAQGAILLNPGANSRRGEVAHIIAALKYRFSTVLTLAEGFADGGDVLTMVDRVVIGLSARTDLIGAQALVRAIAQLGLRAVIAHTPRGVLHFKTGCSLIDAETVLAVPAMRDCPEFKGLRVIETAEGEAAAANVLGIGDHVLIGDSFTRTRDRIEALGIATIALPVREIGKIDAGLSCMSLRWSKLDD